MTSRVTYWSLPSAISFGTVSLNSFTYLGRRSKTSGGQQLEHVCWSLRTKETCHLNETPFSKNITCDGSSLLTLMALPTISIMFCVTTDMSPRLWEQGRGRNETDPDALTLLVVARDHAALDKARVLVGVREGGFERLLCNSSERSPLTRGEDKAHLATNVVLNTTGQLQLTYSREFHFTQ
jgi:hypothetical protein